MNSKPKDKHRHAQSRLARELAGLLLVAAGSLGLVHVAYGIHPLVGTAFVASVLLGFGSWTLAQRPRVGRPALAVGTFSVLVGLLLALSVGWALSPLCGLAIGSAAAAGFGLWLTSGEVR
ncbi:hypothetical protein OG723_44085 (plasmid) [Streptomyces sp. NBC_01278]|uniref:hypothetical protein n=1 Tax=Streptomyces sp. NBC_01278 TaxID=2903809 RepID=UPI002E2F5EDD|nr:hypothetical protein [Streptomyces sp. NBC_01278]